MVLYLLSYIFPDLNRGLPIHGLTMLMLGWPASCLRRTTKHRVVRDGLTGPLAFFPLLGLTLQRAVLYLRSYIFQS